MARSFKLQKVLNLRLRMEEEARLRLLESRRRKEEARHKYAEIQRKRAAAREELECERRKGISAAVMLLLENSILHYDGELGRAAAEIEEMERDIGSRRKELTEAGRERMSLEKLKERIETRNMRKLAREENLVLDEIALRRKGGFE